jgi:hypothetical protein
MLGTAFPAEFGDAKTVVNEVVADTNFLIPMRRAEAPIPFENFRYPYLDDAGNVLFIGNDVVTLHASGRNGIFRSMAATGELITLLRQEDPAPGDGQPFGTIMGLHTDGPSLVFHRGGDRGKGIYGIFDNKTVVTIADRGTPVPGRSAVFDWFWYADVALGNVVFHGSYGPREQDVCGLYWYRHSDRILRPLVDETQPIPQTGGLCFTMLAYQPRIHRAGILFSAGTKDGNGQPLPSRGIFGWPIQMDSTGNFDPSSVAIDRLQVLALCGMAIPESGGLPLTCAPNPVGSPEVVAVLGGSDATDPFSETPAYQCILVRTRDGVWHNPVDTNTVIPNLPGEALFLGFNKWLAVDGGDVIFRAFGPDEYQAVYLYDSVKDILYFITDTHREIEGRRIASLEVSDHPISGSRMALMVRFEDKTSGVYLASLPGLPVRPARAKSSK